MNDFPDFMLGEHPGQRIRITHIRLDEGGAFRREPARAGREIVQRNGGLAGVFQRQKHMCADIAGAARHQNAHLFPPLFTPFKRDSLTEIYSLFDRRSVPAGEEMR